MFRLDDKNYTGLVFAGLAALKLCEYEEARGYYKSAIACQPDGPLAWKVWMITNCFSESHYWFTIIPTVSRVLQITMTTISQ